MNSMLVGLVILAAASNAALMTIPCMTPGNLDASKCLFDGDHCNWSTDFSNWENEHVGVQAYSANPVPGFESQFVLETEDESKHPYLLNGKLQMEVTPATSPGIQGKGTIVSTSRSLLYGTVEATFTQSGIPGVVTSFITAANNFDEIDIEITGADLHNVNANWYYRGNELLDANGANVNGFSTYTNDDNSAIEHTYTIDWSPERITFAINGVVFKTSLASDSPKGYPNSPMRVSFGVWQTPLASNWAGQGDPTKILATPPTVVFTSMKVSCMAKNGPAAVISKPGAKATNAPGGTTAPNKSNPTSSAVSAIPHLFEAALGLITIFANIF